MFTSFSTVVISLLITFTIAVRVPSGKRTHLSPNSPKLPKSTRIFHKRRLNQSLPGRDRRFITKSFNKGKRNDGEAIIQCKSETFFSICFEDGEMCSEPQAVAFGTICVDGGIQLAASVTLTEDLPPASTVPPDLSLSSASSNELETTTTDSIPITDPLPTQSSEFNIIISPTEMASASADSSDSPNPVTSSDFIPASPKPVPVEISAPIDEAEIIPASNSGSSEVFSGGKGTFYNQEGGIGACGKTFTDSDFIVALALSRYGTGSNNAPDCGKTVQITNLATGLSTIAQIADACPGCYNYNSIDLSVAAFNAIAKPETGVIDIIWNFV